MQARGIQINRPASRSKDATRSGSNLEEEALLTACALAVMSGSAAAADLAARPSMKPAAGLVRDCTSFFPRYPSDKPTIRVALWAALHGAIGQCPELAQAV